MEDKWASIQRIRELRDLLSPDGPGIPDNLNSADIIQEFEELEEMLEAQGIFVEPRVTELKGTPAERTEAVRLATEQAKMGTWDCPHCGGTGQVLSQGVVSCMAMGSGGDWSLGAVTQTIYQAKEVRWISGMLGYNLAVRDVHGMMLYFQVTCDGKDAQ